MKPPFLILRAMKAYSDKVGLDGLICIDYMGSSEFENGAVGKSLKMIRAFSLSYIFKELEIDGRFFTVFCPEGDQEIVFDYIRKIGKDQYRLKERAEFSSYLKMSTFDIIEDFMTITDFWWDIENHYFWFEQDKEFEERLTATIYFPEGI